MKANELKVGQRYKGKLLEVRIMAIVEGYVMCRHKGCMPFVESVKDFIKRDLPLITGNELEVKM